MSGADEKNTLRPASHDRSQLDRYKPLPQSKPERTLGKFDTLFARDPGLGAAIEVFDAQINAERKRYKGLPGAPVFTAPKHQHVTFGIDLREHNKGVPSGLRDHYLFVTQEKNQFDDLLHRNWHVWLAPKVYPAAQRQSLPLDGEAYNPGTYGKHESFTGKIAGQHILLIDHDRASLDGNPIKLITNPCWLDDITQGERFGGVALTGSTATDYRFEDGGWTITTKDLTTGQVRQFVQQESKDHGHLRHYARAPMAVTTINDPSLYPGLNGDTAGPPANVEPFVDLPRDMKTPLLAQIRAVPSPRDGYVFRDEYALIQLAPDFVAPRPKTGLRSASPPSPSAKPSATP